MPVGGCEKADSFLIQQRRVLISARGLLILVEMKEALFALMLFLHVISVAEEDYVFSSSVSSIVSNVIESPESFPEIVDGFSDKEKTEILWGILARADSSKSWRGENEALVQSVSSQLRSNGLAANVLSDLLIRSVKPNSGRRREGLFNIASEVGTPQVIFVVGGYLSDDRNFGRAGSDGDVSIYTFSPKNSLLAARSLGGMKITGAPFDSKDPLTYDETDLEKWKSWWSSARGRVWFLKASVE